MGLVASIPSSSFYSPVNNASALIKIRNTDQTVLRHREAWAWAIRKRYRKEVDLKNFHFAILLASEHNRAEILQIRPEKKHNHHSQPSILLQVRLRSS
jgi:hypothetical protein